MKRVNLLIAALVMSVVAAWADSPEKSVRRESSPRFVYEVYGEIPTVKPAFEEEHYLGGVITAKWNTFCESYTRVHDMSIGFSGQTVETLKPSIYKAVHKVNKFYKKALRKGLVNREEAVKEMIHILDCANVMCLEDATSDFEKAVNDAESPEQIIRLFDSVQLKFN